MHRRILTTTALSASLLPLIRAASAQTAAAPHGTAMQALAGGAFSLQTSRLAQSRAAAAPVRQFAQMEAEEQSAIIDALRLVGMTIPAELPLDPAKTEALRRLQAAQGAEFDRAYLSAQLTGHQELQRLHTAIAASSDPAPARAISTVAVPAIKTHIALIEMLQEHHRG